MKKLSQIISELYEKFKFTDPTSSIKQSRINIKKTTSKYMKIKS